MPKIKSSSASSSNFPYSFVRSETQLFDEPVYDVSLSSTNASEYHSLNSTSDPSTPIEFFIQSNDVQFIDLSETKLYLKAKIVKAEGGADIPATEVVAPVNNFLHSLFQQCSIYLNEVLVTPSSNQYAYRSYIETVLAYSKEFKKSQAQGALYYKDKDPNTKGVGDEDDDGYKTRFEMTKGSATFELIGRPFADLFVQNKYLIPGIDVRVQFTRSTPEFCLFAAADGKYKIIISDAKLLVQKHTLLPSLVMKTLKTWEHGKPISYPMKRVEIKTYSLAPGTLTSVNENLLSGLLPDRIIIGLVASTDYLGSITTNPFHFRHFGLNYVNVSVNGDQSTNLPIHLDWTSNVYIQLYNNLFYGLGIANDDAGIDLSRIEYKKHPLMVFNLRHTKEGFPNPKHGNVKLELKFGANNQGAITVLVYAEYQSVLHIDNNKNVYFKDYSNTSI